MLQMTLEEAETLNETPDDISHGSFVAYDTEADVIRCVRETEDDVANYCDLDVRPLQVYEIVDQRMIASCCNELRRSKAGKCALQGLDTLLMYFPNLDEANKEAVRQLLNMAAGPLTGSVIDAVKNA